MPQETYGQVWKKLLLYAPNCPTALAREMVRQAYRSVLDAHYWSELRQDAEVYIPARYGEGTADLTNGSATVNGNGTTWTTDPHQFMQFSVGSRTPWYTIATVVGPTELTLDRPYAGGDLTATPYEIGKFYLDFPTDLEVLEEVRDRENNWKITTHYYNQAYLDRIDSSRQSTGTPVCIVGAPPRTDPTTGDVIPRYEMWPRTSEKVFLYRYYKRHDVDANTDRFIDAFNSELVVYKAIANLAMWPGTQDQPNPFFSMDNHRTYTQMFEEKLRDAVVADVDRVQTMIDYNDTGLRYPADAKFFQTHPL